MRPFQSGLLAIEATGSLYPLLPLARSRPMLMVMADNIVFIAGALVLMLLLILLLVLLTCKPWRFFSRSRTRGINVPQIDDLERPLVSEDLNFVQNQSVEFRRNNAFDGVGPSVEGHVSSAQTHGTGYKQQPLSAATQLTQSRGFILGIIPDPSEDIFVGQTLKRPSVTHYSVEEQSMLGRKI
ncbi:Phosphoprotein phosphatase [Bertholletia excelsa]